MRPLIDAALEMQAFLQERHWRFCFIGGLVLLRWSEPRATQDVDLTLLSGFGDEESFIRPLLARYQSRCSNAESFAVRNRVLLLTASNGVDIDVSLGGLPYEEKIIERASPFAFTPEATLITCSAEDLLILKAFANRALDWRDVEGILVRQHNHLDWPYIMKHLPPLCALKEDSAIEKRLDQLRQMLEAEAQGQ